MEELAEGKCASLNGSSSLDMVELQPLLAEISRTLNAPEKIPEAFHLPGLSQHPELPKPYFPGECGSEEPCPGRGPGMAALPSFEPGSPESCPGRGPEMAPPCPPAEPGSPEPCPGRSLRTQSPPPRNSLRQQGPAPSSPRTWVAFRPATRDRWDSQSLH